MAADDRFTEAFMSIWKTIWNKTLESLPFQQEAQDIPQYFPDYLTIITHPMDLLMIKQKLINKEYNQDPIAVVEDFWLMFNNAWRYNSKTSRVYTWCTRLADMFREKAKPVMNEFGYCCVYHHSRFNDQVLICCGKPNCFINQEMKYMCYPHEFHPDAYHYCMECFEREQRLDGTIMLAKGINLQDGTLIHRDQFIEAINRDSDEDRHGNKFLKCLRCGMKLHHLCVANHHC